jgi:ribosomal protein S18 acetylase RimI-like enzyme
MEDTELVIRPASPDDLPAVRELLVETWHDTYDPLLGAAKVTEITDDWHSLANLERQLAVPDTVFLVAAEEGRITGHLFANGRQLPLLILSRLYVLPAFQRRGVGARLLAAALAHFPQARSIGLDVEAGNAKGRAFYTRQGFVPVGESVQAGISHIRLEKRIAPSE